MLILKGLQPLFATFSLLFRYFCAHCVQIVCHGHRLPVIDQAHRLQFAFEGVFATSPSVLYLSHVVLTKCLQPTFPKSNRLLTT